MARLAGATAAVLAALAITVPTVASAAPPGPWNGANPFRCHLQQAGFAPTGTDPDADPLCVEFDKRHQNITQLGIVGFLLNEPARVAAAAGKCFYFQRDHWRASVVQADASTRLYEWDGSYFFDKARGDGGVYVTNFKVNGRTADPTPLFAPLAPLSRPVTGPGTFGIRTDNAVAADPRCAARASADPGSIYVHPPG